MKTTKKMKINNSPPRMTPDYLRRLAEFHLGPGNHPNGSPQDAHDGNRADDNAAKKSKPSTDKPAVNFSEGSAEDLLSGYNELDPSLKGFIAVYTPEQYAEIGAKVYLSDDKKSGYAIKPNGELISVYSTAKGRGRAIMQSAVDHGATKLDCYEDPASKHLTQLYGSYGFKETERLKWDDQYAPAGWDYQKFDNPDVVFMERS